MPIKDKEVQREQARLRMQKMRNKGVTNGGVTSSSVTDWETLPLGDIKSVLPQDIVMYAENVGKRYGNTEIRLRRAYKYHLWHERNFINGVHKDSKYRQFVEATR